MRNKKNQLLGLIAITFVMCAELSFAQYHREHGDKENTNGWKVLIEPYFMLPYINGTVGVRSLPNASINQKPGDVFSMLKMQGMLSGEVYNKDWVFTTDLIYLRMGEDVEAMNGIISGNATLTQFNWEVAGMRRFLPWLDAGIALQLNSYKADLDLVMTTPLGALPIADNGSRTWVDPSFVGRAFYAFSESKKWFVQGRANIGGFGIGSKFYWQVQPTVGYHFSKLFQLSLGYRAIGMNYERGDASNRLLYNVVTHGPVFRFGFNVN